jgi:hypothetical protein
MILGNSIQAKFLVSMAILVGIGTPVSSLVILLLIPAILSMMENFRRPIHKELVC